MDLPPIAGDDVLAQSIRARLFQTLARLRRPATTQELAAQVGRHPNSVRVQLQRLADVGLLERRDVAQPRGRPRQEWAIAATARPAGRRPQALEQLSRWLARAAGTGGLQDIEAAGHEIGREIAPERRDRPVAEALHDSLAALGFEPECQMGAGPDVRYVLGNCPYRDAVAENQPVVCALHRGMTSGLLQRLDRKARLTGFLPKDPYRAGCLVDVTLAPAGPGGA
jgi:predicted ArsR family transcriptional regulator